MKLPDGTTICVPRGKLLKFPADPSERLKYWLETKEVVDEDDL